MKLDKFLVMIDELIIEHGDKILDYEVCFTDESKIDCPQCNHKFGLQLEDEVVEVFPQVREWDGTGGMIMLLGSRFDNVF